MKDTVGVGHDALADILHRHVTNFVIRHILLLNIGRH